MKKSRIKQIVREVLTEEKGYSKYVDGGKTDGLTQDTLEKILLKIARQGEEIEEEKYEGDPERGNKILDTADPENVARILRGEDEEVDRMQELAGLKSEIKVNNPIYQEEPITIYQKDGDRVTYYDEDFLPEDEISEEEDERIMKEKWMEFINKIKKDPQFREDIYNERAEYTGYGEVKFKKGE
jgi:hypothetical protein